ncbi:hypothetical protein [Bacillus toyonensis]|uniref:hypothetical protein n=1 Tax=Bacillus toyonensis TaxID=155322 RepID=UPI002E1E540B|nr:hypothetical protein [Bacillus toyonensis]
MFKNLSFSNQIAIYRFISLFILLSISVIIYFTYTHYFNKPEPENTSLPAKVSNREIPKEPVLVYTLNTTPFNNTDFATYKPITKDDLLNLKKPSIILTNTKQLNSDYKDILLTLAKNKHSIVFYDKEIDPEQVVLFFDGLIPVVPIESTIPLSYQAYGITTLEDKLIPVILASSTDGELDKNAFEQVFIKLYNTNVKKAD